jgi:uncharacterized tellurite resistance protein B-like protein
MHIVIGALGLLAGIYFFLVRARNRANMAGDLLDAAQDVRLAARRFGFRRKTNIHPVETIEDPKLAIGAIATAFVELDDLPTREQREALKTALAENFALDAEAAEEITILGHWFVSECKGPDAAIPRLSRKLSKMSGREGFTTLLGIVDKTLASSDGTLNARQREGLEEVKRAFRVS